MSRLHALLCAALLAALVLVAPARAAAAVPTIGIGEQHPDIFGNPLWTSLGIKDVRVIAAYNALDSNWQAAELDHYMTMAQAAGARVLLGFGHSRGDGKEHRLPTVASYARHFRAFRARYPWVQDFLVWNEANHCSQPTCRNPERAARFYRTIRPYCADCRIVAADVLDGKTMVPWVKRFRRAAGKGKIIWGLHNYLDANRYRTSGTRALLRAVKGEVWFTETAGLIRRSNGSSVVFPGSTKHAAKATKWIFKLAALSPRVKRVYLYQWSPDGPKATWDSALIDAKGRPRPAYGVLQRWLATHRP